MAGGVTTVEVRLYRSTDAAAVIQLALEMARDLNDPSPTLTSELLDEVALSADPWCWIWVATADEQAVGFAVTCRRFEAHMGQRSLFLADLHVAEGARRGGVATALMAAVGRQARSLNCATVAWTLWTKNSRGRAFYDRIGAAVDQELLVVSAKADVLERLA